MSTRLHCSTLFLLAGALAAQPMPHPTTSPKAFTGVYSTGGRYLPPLGRTGGLTQCWRHGSDFRAPQLLLSTGVRASLGLPASAVTIRLELTMANTPVTFASFSATFAQNFGPSPAVVFTRKPVNLPAMSTQDPDIPWAWFVHDQPFVFFGPHFLVQFDLGTTANAQGTLQYSDLVQGGEVTHRASNVSCGGTLVASGSGNSYLLDFATTSPFATGVLMLGNENVLLGGNPSLPFRLDSFGMTPIQSKPCFLGLVPLVSAGFQVGASGSRTWRLPIQYTSASMSDVIYAQVLHTAAGNPAGWATSNVVHSILGGSGLANDIANVSRDGPVAEYGPSAFNTGAVLLFRP